jgi:hypothetical protein
MTGVNSVSLQPKFTPTPILARRGAFALPNSFALTRTFAPFGALEHFEIMAVEGLLDNFSKQVMRGVRTMANGRTAVNGCRSCWQARN